MKKQIDLGVAHKIRAVTGVLPLVTAENTANETVSSAKRPHSGQELFIVENHEPVAERLIEFDLLTAVTMPDLSKVLFGAN